MDNQDYFLLIERIGYKLNDITTDLKNVVKIVNHDLELEVAKSGISSEFYEEVLAEMKKAHFKRLLALKKCSLNSAKKKLEQMLHILS